MHETWRELGDHLLRPARPRLEHCVRERDAHQAAGRIAAEARLRATANCEGRIREERAAVFAADDGVISARMTELEREWRALSRVDPDGGLMDLWARIAPRSWIDRKRWRDSEPSRRLDAAVALAADPEGVDAAESALRALRNALIPWGARIGHRIAWRPFDTDTDCVSGLLAEPHRAAREAVANVDGCPLILERTEILGRVVYDMACARFPERPLFAQSLAHAAVVDGLLRAGALVDRPNPVTPLRDLWKTGYTLVAIDDSGVTLEIPNFP